MKPTIEQLVASKELFHSFVYTPIHEALDEIKRRKQDEELTKSIETFLPDPPPFAKKSTISAVLLRNVATPNYTFIRFLNIIHALGLPPIFFEYFADKFTTHNEDKKSLGRLGFFVGRGKDGKSRIVKHMIIVNEANGRPISSVQTLWGEPLTDFHHSLFSILRKRISSVLYDIPEDAFYDASEWLHDNGGQALHYYKKLMWIFLRDSLMFENFVFEHQGEIDFIREVFLPAFFEVYEKTGVKPLIIALNPTEIEEDDFWMSYPHELEQYILEKLQSTHGNN